MFGTYRVAVQHENLGYFAVVDVDVQLLASGGELVVEFAAPSEWQFGVQFGIAYACEKTLFAQRTPPGVRVRVTRVEGHAVDTTQVIAAYAAAHALCNALQVPPPPGLKLDQATGTVAFQK